MKKLFLYILCGIYLFQLSAQGNAVQAVTEVPVASPVKKVTKQKESTWQNPSLHHHSLIFVRVHRTSTGLQHSFWSNIATAFSLPVVCSTNVLLPAPGIRNNVAHTAHLAYIYPFHYFW